MRPRDVVRARREQVRRLARRSREVVLLTALVGVVTGLAVAAFEWVVDVVALHEVATWPLALVALAPVAGLVAADLARRWIGGPGTDAATADEYLRAFHDPGHHLSGRRLLGRTVAAVATIGSGGPMGLEGPSLHIGSSLGAMLQRRVPRPFRGRDHRVLLVAGAAAGVAAIFKAPATGAIFALEVPYRDDLARRMLLPALVASATGYLTFAALHGTQPLFAVAGEPTFAWRDLAGAVALGLVAGVGARAFADAVRRAKRWAQRPLARRLALAGPALVVLFVLGRAASGRSVVLGSGLEVVRWATEAGTTSWVLAAVLVLRAAAVAATVAGGGVGGLFVPLAVCGALVGRITGHAVHTLDPDLFTVIGVAAFLGAGYRVPLAAVMFVAETTGRPGFVVPGLLAAVAAELVMGGASVTAYQQGPSGPPPAVDAA